MVEDIKNGVSPIPKLKEALYQIENRRVSADLLSISLAMRKNPEEYEQNCKQNRLGSKLGLHKGDTLVYYKCDNGEMAYDSENPPDISYTAYKNMLINSVKDVLQILGYDVEERLLHTDASQLIDNIRLNPISIPDTATAAPVSQIDSRVTNKKKETRSLVSEGIEIILSLFAAVEQRLFPRTIMTKCTNGQVRSTVTKMKLCIILRLILHFCRRLKNKITKMELT